MLTKHPFNLKNHKHGEALFQKNFFAQNYLCNSGKHPNLHKKMPQICDEVLK